MFALTILTGAKLRQLEEKNRIPKSNIDYTLQKNGGITENSSENKLYALIEDLIKRSHTAEADEKTALLREADELQMQLTARLKLSGFHNVAQFYADNIQALLANPEKK